MIKENGITMLVLIISIVILLVIMGITFSFTSGDDGMVAKTSNASFEADIQQIMELMKEKETLFNLEEITNPAELTSSIKQSILDEYYNVDAEKPNLDIYCTYNPNDGIRMTLIYNESGFNESQIKILKEKGAQKM